MRGAWRGTGGGEAGGRGRLEFNGVREVEGKSPSGEGDERVQEGEGPGGKGQRQAGCVDDGPRGRGWRGGGSKAAGAGAPSAALLRPRPPWHSSQVHSPGLGICGPLPSSQRLLLRRVV